MSDESAAETSPEPEVIGEEVEANEYEDVNEVAEGEEDSTESEDQPEELVDDSEEIEFNQKNYKLPKDVAAAVRDMQKDYTVKTQAVAEQRKSFEAQVQFQQTHIQEFAKVVALNDQIAECQKVDFMALSAEDPQRAQQLSFYLQGLERQRNELAQQITQKNQQSTLEKQQEFAKQIEESESVLKRDIKDWSPELETKLMQFSASNYGIDKEDFTSSKTNPRVMKLIHDAYIGKQLIQKQTAKPKIVQAQPVTTLSAKGSKSAPNPANMTQDQYAKWRRQGYK